MLSLLLTGCVNRQHPSVDSDHTTSHSNILSAKQLSHWQIRGRVAVKQQQKGFNASLYWQQSGAQQTSLTLSGPLGSGMIRVIRRGQQVTLDDGKQRWQSNRGDQLLAEHTGYPLPITALFYWVRGIPMPGSPYQVDSSQHELKQLGWRIQFARRRPIRGVMLPDKLILTRGTLRIKLLIQSWRFKA